jgi:hypothetical protein
MSAPERMEERLTARDLTIARVQASEARRALRELRDLEKIALAIIREVDPADPARRGDRFNRVTRVLALLRGESRRVYRALARRTVRLQADLIEEESKAVKAAAGRAGLPLTRTLTPTQAEEIADKLLLDGATSSDHWNRQERGVRDEVEKRLRQAVVADASTSDMVRSVRGDRDLRYGNGAFRPFERYATATLQTAVAGASNAARFETYRVNADVVSMVQAINPLDSRTSPICQARAGRVWSLSTGKGVGATDSTFPGPPPWHIGCRTTLIPIDRQSSPVRGRTFSQLLDSMSEDEQRELLGPGKFELWRKGDIAVQDLVDQSGRPLTVAQLRARHT